MPTYVTCNACGSSNVLNEETRTCFRCGEALSSPTEDKSPSAREITRAMNPSQPPPFAEEVGRREEYEDRPARRLMVNTRREKARKQAVILLFTITGLQLLCGMLVVGIGDNIPQLNGIDKMVIAAILVVTAAVFAGLGIWAIYSPMVPTILGLIIYAVLAVLDMAEDPKILVNPGFWIRIAIIVGLIQTIGELAKTSTPSREMPEDE